MFAERCGIFARSLLGELPELESVLIVPGWLRVDETGLPSGVVMGRAGPLQHIQETAHLLTQTVRAVNALADNMDQHLEGFEQQSNALAARLSLQMQKLGPGPGKD